jgi:hypothetical protein
MLHTREVVGSRGSPPEKIESSINGIEGLSRLHPHGLTDLRLSGNYASHMVQARTMINAGATVDQVAAVGRVIRKAGFEGECVAELAAQGGGISAVMLDIGPKTFFGGLVGAAGVDAWKRLKALMVELREAFGAPEGPHLQLYLRPDAVTKAEWEESNHELGPPGFHRSNTPDSDPIR